MNFLKKIPLWVWMVAGVVVACILCLRRTAPVTTSGVASSPPAPGVPTPVVNDPVLKL